MQAESVSKLDASTFEWVCSGIIREIAIELGFTPIGIPQPMAVNYDGGIEAKIDTQSGGLAIQCKAYQNFASGGLSAQKSFKTFLCEPQHNAVRTYVWCSTSTRTVGNEEAANKTREKMVAALAGTGRMVDVHPVLFAGDLDRILRERRPEYLSILSGFEPLSFTDVAGLSEFEASRILARFGTDDVPQLEFPCPRTANVLDRVGKSTKSGLVDVEDLQPLVNTLRYRAREVGRDAPIDACADFERLTDLLNPLLVKQGVPTRDLRPALVKAEARAKTSLDCVLEGITALRDSRYEPVGSEHEISEQVTFDLIRAYGRSIDALLECIASLRLETEAALLRRLLITGPWGTGKSYQLATHATKALATRQPVLLLRARDFTRPDAPILRQPWRGRLRNEDATAEEFFAMLDAIGWKSEAPLLIAIDGLNESLIRDIPAALRRLCELVDRFPNVMLVVTDRQDHEVNGGYELPRFVHRAPDRAVMSQVLEVALGAPPGTRWHAALANPLLASVGAWVISAQQNGGADPTPILGRVDLLNAWTNLLVREISTAMGLEKATVQRVVDEISRAGGRIGVYTLAAAVSVNTDLVDSVIRRLIDEGLLESDAAVKDVVRFHWQGAGDLLLARQAMIDNGMRGADAFIDAADAANRQTAIESIAELVPRLDSPAELPDLRLRSVTDTERDITFAWSLSARSDDTVSDRTLWHAERLLRQGDEAAEAIVWCILGGARRKKLGPAWLIEQLRTCTLAERSWFWPAVLEAIADSSPQSQADLAELLTWYAETLWREARETDGPTLVEFLAWMSCAPHWTRLRDYAVHSIVEIFRHSPKAFAVVLERLRTTEDDHPRDALFAAAAGVVARWPDSESAKIVHETCHDLLQRCPAPQSFRSLAELHRVLNDERPMHTFLNQTIGPPPRERRLGRVGAFIPDDDRAMFADGRDARSADRLEAAIWDSFGIGRRHAKAILAADESNGTTLLDDSHGGSLIRGRWLARQYAEFPVGARLSHGLQPVKAGTPGNQAVQFLVDPGGGWEQYVDPSVPLALTIRGSDCIRTSTWWAIRPEAVTSEPDVLHVTDSDGVGWIVIEAGFRLIEPEPAVQRDRPTISVGNRSWALGSEDDGRPRPGSSRHEYLRVSRAALVATHRGERSRYFERQRFGDMITAESPGGDLTNAHHDDAEVAPPTSTLLSLLGAKWTGDGIDCRDADGILVVTDPAVGTDSPHAVLVRRDALERTLHQEGVTVSVEIAVRDLSAPYPSSKERCVNVTLGVERPVEPAREP